MKNLSLYNTESIDELAWPSEDFSISKNTPALDILTDFTHQLPSVIWTKIKATEVEARMKRAHVKMKLVVDAHNKFVGIISLSDLSEENILKKVNKSIHRDELEVSDFMLPKEKVKCFDYHELTGATVNDVLVAQRNNNQQHCLVIDRESHQVRGLISARDVARKIKHVNDLDKHLSFEALFNEVA